MIHRSSVYCSGQTQYDVLSGSNLKTLWNQSKTCNRRGIRRAKLPKPEIQKMRYVWVTWKSEEGWEEGYHSSLKYIWKSDSINFQWWPLIAGAPPIWGREQWEHRSEGIAPAEGWPHLGKATMLYLIARMSGQPPHLWPSPSQHLGYRPWTGACRQQRPCFVRRKPLTEGTGNKKAGWVTLQWTASRRENFRQALTCSPPQALQCR